MSVPSGPAPVAPLIEALQRGDAAGAEAIARRLLQAYPRDGEAMRLLGVALLMLGRGAEAQRVLADAVSLRPHNVETRANLAAAQLANRDAIGAVRLLRQLVAEQPADAALHNNLANALRGIGDDARARDEYLAALALEPDHFNAIANLAATELSLGLAADAEARLRAVLARQPHPQAWLLLGHALQNLRRFAEAQAAYAEGGKLAPAAAAFPYQAGLMADEQHHYPEAIRLYQRALQLDPSLQLAQGQLLFALRRVCDWAGAAQLSGAIKRRATDGSGTVDPFAFLAEDTTPAEQLACAQARAASVNRDVEPTRQHVRLPHTPHAAAGALRVGFVSAGFHAHATALLTVALFEALAGRDDIDVHLFATTHDDGSPVRQRLAAACHVHDVAGEPDARIALRVFDAGIDVLVDVDGWCAGGVPGVFALRPAPVQASWLAYPGTTGAPYIDYLIADSFVIPESLRRFYSEAIAYLPRCYQPSDTTRAVGTAPPRAVFGLPRSGVVFASFNNAWKLNAASFARMCAVLRGVPDSVLWLLDPGHAANGRLREAAQRHGVEPRRLVFSPALPHAQHLARHCLADLFLDTNPYNAHTTASDAIWAGCPVLTRPGDTFASRVAGSLDHFLGMPELIARDDAAFVESAIRFGNDRSVLDALHARLAERRTESGLFDMCAYAVDFAALLRGMAGRQRQGLPPATFTQGAA